MILNLYLISLLSNFLFLSLLSFWFISVIVKPCLIFLTAESIFSEYVLSKRLWFATAAYAILFGALQWYGESLTPRITDMRSRQLPASLIRRVGDSPHHRYGESAMEFFKRKLSVSMIRRVVNFPHQWYSESPTPRITKRRVDDSAYRWVGESMTLRIGNTGSRYSKKEINLVSIFCTFNG